MIRAFCLWLMMALPAFAASLSREDVAKMVVAPYAVGDQISDKGVWDLLNSGGGKAGYVFETGGLAPLPGFSGKPINILVMLDLEGRFIATKLIAQHEPIFVSGLIYLDGVTKATASVRIAHESILAATLAVAREKMQGHRQVAGQLTWR